LIEFYAAGLYIEDTDWPGNNDGAWRNFGDKIEGNKFGDGRWRFIIFDLDLSMNPPFRWNGNGGNRGNNGNGGWGNFKPRNSIFDNVVNRYDRSPLNPLFISLLKNNTDFHHKFINKYCDFANEIFKPSRVKQILERYREKYPQLVADSLVRWNMRNLQSKLEEFSKSRSSFLKSIDSIESFFKDRANYTLQNMIDFIGLKKEVVNLNIEIIGKGKVQINSIIPDFNDNKWTGKYITKIPITIQAIPAEGNNFIEWGGYIESVRQNEEIILFENATITVYFD
jgi:hypothetical protein